MLFLQFLFLLVVNTIKVDVNTFSNYKDIRIKHLHLEWMLNLENKSIEAIAQYTFKSLKQQQSIIQLDIYKMQINSVILWGKSLHFSIESDPNQTEKQGDTLKIELPFPINRGKIIQIIIKYSVNENARALSFLNAEQTDSGITNYLFSQCQTNNCRSIIPLQDTPSVKFTYSATVLTIDPLINVFMSGNRISNAQPVQLIGQYSNVANIYQFQLNIPIPAYLIAIVAGAIEESKIGSRTSIISEKLHLQKYSKEMEDMEHYLELLEQYIGPYKWGIARIVVLPASFPFGGMEHPLLVFVNPTVIVGDKSAMAVVVHELAHSWVGNTVTCSDWSNYWINEGFCMFLERKILTQLYDKNYALVDAYVGKYEMLSDVSEYQDSDNPSYASLYPNLIGQNPDDSYSRVPYEKGYQLIYYLESIIGEDHFQKLLQGWIIKYEYKSVDYKDFKLFLMQWLKQNKTQDEFQKIRKQINKIYHKWVFESGVAPIDIDFSGEDSQQVLELAQDWLEDSENISKDIFNKFHSIQKQFFLELLMDGYQNLTLKQIKQLEEQYQLNDAQDAAVKYRWFIITVKCKYTNESTNMRQVEQFLSTVGKERMILPIYTNLNLELSQTLYEKNKAFYHPLVRQDIETMLKNRQVKLKLLIQKLNRL